MNTKLLGLVVAAGALYAGAAHADRSSVHCRSSDYNYNECEVGGGRGGRIIDVRLIRQESSASCRNGQSYGVTNRGDAIWVSNGCEGDFEVRFDDRWDPRPPRSTIVSCSSNGDRYNTCSLGRDYARDVRLYRQVSNSSCREGRDWGFDYRSNSIWVDHGCRAQFEVIYDNRFGGRGDRFDGRDDRFDGRDDRFEIR